MLRFGSLVRRRQLYSLPHPAFFSLRVRTIPLGPHPQEDPARSHDPGVTSFLRFYRPHTEWYRYVSGV